MPDVIDCPSCGRKLHLPEELIGQTVQCPGCGTNFTAKSAVQAGPEPAHVADALPLGDQPRAAPEGELDLSLGEGGAPRPAARNIPPPPRPLRPVPVGRRGASVCRYCGERVARGALECPWCHEVLDEDDAEDDRPFRMRRDWEPHRGGLVLTLGIISVVLFGICGVAGLPCGIAAWVMGHNDLAKMRANVMDPGGMGNTRGGWICGIIGTILDTLWVLCIGGQMLK